MRSFCLFLLLAIAASPFLRGQEQSRGHFRLTMERSQVGERRTQLTLTASPGSVLYQISRELPYDTPLPKIHLFADGTVLLVDVFAGAYERYAENGRMVERFAFNGRISPNHERIGFLSGNDSSAVLFISEPGQSESRLLFLDSHGTLKLDQAIQGSFASGLEISPVGNMIALGTYSWEGSSLTFRTEFLRTDGTIVSSVEREFKGGSWSPQESLFVIYGRKLATVFDVEKGEIVSTSDLGDNRVVHDVLWDGPVPLIVSSPPPRLESGAWIYSQLSVLNLADQKVTYRSTGQPFRRVKLEENAGEISVNIDGRLVRIR